MPAPTDAAAVNALGATVTTLMSQLAGARSALADAAGRIAGLEQQIGELGERVTASESARAGSSGAVTAHAARAAAISLLWLGQAPLRRNPLVSVVMPTYSRARLELLRGAVDSVLDQTYPAWELLVVDNSDDGMLDSVPDWWPQDDRVRVLRSTPHRASEARNVGLDAAAGEFIAYLDDDCRWFPWWLRTAVATFEFSPSSIFVHGIRFSGGPSMSPGLVQAESVTPLKLHVDNFVDTNTLVHRGDTGERWDEALHACSDYDLMVRIAHHPHQFVPVPACTYGIGTPGQVWSLENEAANRAERDEVRARARRRRPLRIVAVDSSDAPGAQTELLDEIEELRRHGADIALAGRASGPTHRTTASGVAVYGALDEALGSHHPDLVLVYGAGPRPAVRDTLTDRGLPYLIRLHPAGQPDLDPGPLDDACIGVWAPPDAEHFDDWVVSLTRVLADWHDRTDEQSIAQRRWWTGR